MDPIGRPCAASKQGRVKEPAKGRKRLKRDDRSTASCGNLSEERNHPSYLPSCPETRSPFADSSTLLDKRRQLPVAEQQSQPNRIFRTSPSELVTLQHTSTAAKYASRTVRTKLPTEAENPEDSIFDTEEEEEIANSRACQVRTTRGYEDGQEEQQAQAGYHRSTHHRHVL